MALSDVGIMPAIVTLADETTHLIKRMPYDELHHRISHLEQELKDTSYDLCHALHKVDDLHHAPAPTISAPIMVEQAVCDFEHAHIASLGGGTYDPSQEAGPSWVDPPPAIPSPSSLWGRIQAKPASQVEPVGKGKAKVPPMDDQVAPDFSMEDEITSAGIYDDIPMVINTAVQGTLFPEFTECENPYRVLCLGQGKDGMRTILFVRVNDNLYTYSDERLSTALTNIHQGTPPPVPTRGIMGPIGLVNTAEHIHKLDQDPNVQAAIDLLRAAIHDPHLPSENQSVKRVNQQAQALGISPERIAAYEAHMFEAGEVYILQEFAVTVALYDLPHLPRGDDQGMSGDSPAGTWEAEEGELLDRPAPM
ncbi:hypothetical protein EDD17DRAFT_1750472 [Pisolithus thermaeus]|nr:hypothetical protein EDD17DRAFT_1750472 [Pisolithus thermaeus]